MHIKVNIYIYINLVIEMKSLNVPEFYNGFYYYFKSIF
jgi:hypothetical protein